MSLLDDLTPTDFALLLDAVESDSPQCVHDDGLSDASDRTGRKQLKTARDPSTSYRRRKREERERLRDQVCELEALLAELQSQNQKQEHVVDGTVYSRVGVWRRMATQQLKSRKTAEDENTRLRKEIVRQHQRACQLKRLVERLIDDKSTTREVQLGSPRLGCGALVPTQHEWTATTAFDRIENIFAEVGFDNLNNDFEDVRVVRATGDSPAYVQVRHARVFPFNKASVLRSTWQPAAILPFIGQTYETKAWTEKLLVVQYEMPAQIGRVDVNVHIELTVRRSEKSFRHISAFSIVYTVRSEHDEYNGVRLLGEGVYTIQELTASDGSESSIIYCLERCKSQGTSIRDMSLVCGIVSEQYRIHFERVENGLMDAALLRTNR